MSCRGAAVGSICIFLVSSSLQPYAVTVKTLSPQGGGGHTLFECYLVAKDSMAFELERCGGMNTCAAPLSGYLSPRLTLQHSLRGREEKKSTAEQGKYPKDVSHVVSPGSEVRGQNGRVCQVLSGADKPMEVLLNAYLAT